MGIMECRVRNLHGLFLGLAIALAGGFLLDTKPAITHVCTFEDSSCGYGLIASAHAHSMKWSRHHVGTSFPDTDNTFHTKGQGNVMYLNGHSSAHTGDSARLQTQTVTFPKGSHISIGFSYSFSGGGSNPLALHVFAKGFHTTTQLLSVSDHSSTGQSHHLTNWFRRCVSTVARDGDITVIFEAVTIHSSNNGDLAIDDVIIEEGNKCHSIQQLNASTSSHVGTTSYPGTPSVNCSFETTDVCGYHNKDLDNFNWQRNMGQTQSAGTGPNGDHTTGKGYYMYIETSSPRHSGDTARIESPTFTSDGKQTLTFWYSAFGTGIGDLKVYVETDGVLGSPIFAESKGTYSASWKQACVPVTKVSSNAKIVFEGVVGGDYHGDIAIDDVRLEHAQCSSGVQTTHSGVQTTHSGVQTTIPSITLDIGDWLSWGSWSSCSTTCGHSTKQRTRKCSNGTCDGSNIQVLQCHTNPCQGTTVDGHWSSWSTYSACTVTCGTGHETTHRTCNNPPPSGGGHTCTGSSVKTIICHRIACTAPTDWSDWSMWSKCTVSCGIGTISRFRSCATSLSGSVQCTGNKTESHECSSGPCPIWSHWYDGKCSSSCGNGTMDRVRMCSTGTSSDCTGSSTQLVPCVGTDCI